VPYLVCFAAPVTHLRVLATLPLLLPYLQSRTTAGAIRLTDRVSPASVKAGATGANAAGVTAKLVGCIR